MDCAVQFLLRSKSILDENRKRILEFKQHCIASGLSVARQLYYLQRLTRIAEKLGKKRFEDCGRADIEALMEYFNTAKKRGTMWWAMIATADDKALRPEEWMTLTIGHIRFDEYGAVATVKSGKVGERRVRLVSSAPALEALTI